MGANGASQVFPPDCSKCSQRYCNADELNPITVVTPTGATTTDLRDLTVTPRHLAAYALLQGENHLYDRTTNEGSYRKRAAVSKLWALLDSIVIRTEN
jgi:hypothetical protein